MNIFDEALSKKLWGKPLFCNKTKTKAFFGELRIHFLDIEKNYKKESLDKYHLILDSSSS